MKEYTSKEAAEIVGLTIRRVQAFAKDHPDVVEKIGRDYFFSEKAISLLKERKGKVGQPRNPMAKYSRFKKDQSE